MSAMLATQQQNKRRLRSDWRVSVRAAGAAASEQTDFTMTRLTGDARGPANHNHNDSLTAVPGSVSTTLPADSLETSLSSVRLPRGWDWAELRRRTAL